jgi:hypothetical protein
MRKTFMGRGLGRGKYYLIAISSARNVEFLRNSPLVIPIPLQRVRDLHESICEKPSKSILE